MRPDQTLSNSDPARKPSTCSDAASWATQHQPSQLPDGKQSPGSSVKCPAAHHCRRLALHSLGHPRARSSPPRSRPPSSLSLHGHGTLHALAHRRVNHLISYSWLLELLQLLRDLWLQVQPEHPVAPSGGESAAFATSFRLLMMSTIWQPRAPATLNVVGGCIGLASGTS